MEVPPGFVAVLAFGDLFPRAPKAPLHNLGPLWRESARRRAAHAAGDDPDDVT